MTIGPNTRLATLLGNPVEHSFSPIIHNTAYQVLALDALYLARAVTTADLAAAVEGLKALRFMGANVTIPFKERIIELTDRMTDEAAAIGAVNTLIFRRVGDDVTIIGDNTDVTGFLAPLQPHQEWLAGGRIVILGAGGAARAVLYGSVMSLSPSEVLVAARRSEQAESLISDLKQHAGTARLSATGLLNVGRHIRDADLVVNTTPVGMYPDIDASPWQDPDAFHQDQIVYDLIYNPVSTRLLKEASARGAIVINGIEMLIGQAAAAHVLWTGLRMPVDEVREVLIKTVGALRNP
ncbi:MAG: shikimate dehydrogenase [Rhodothermia bacterium]|nr:shikimate dehydrogenase [Rhodothermia bacterium]